MSMVSPPAPEVTTSEAAVAIERGSPLIDVREPDEYASGHVPEAQLIPLGEVMERYGELDGSKTIYVICAVGGRSMAAAGALRQLGFDAVSVAGGTNRWAQEGRPIVSDN